MARIAIALALLVATGATPAAAQIIGNTLQAAMDVRITLCTPAGQCQTAPGLPPGAINVYFAKNGTAFAYRPSGRQGLELPIGRFVARAEGGQHGLFIAGNRIDFKFTASGMVVGIGFRVAGSRCTMSGIATSTPQVKVDVRITPKYCRIVQGRVER